MVGLSFLVLDLVMLFSAAMPTFMDSAWSIRSILPCAILRDCHKRHVPTFMNWPAAMTCWDMLPGWPVDDHRTTYFDDMKETSLAIWSCKNGEREPKHYGNCSSTFPGGSKIVEYYEATGPNHKHMTYTFQKMSSFPVNFVKHALSNDLRETECHLP